MTLKCHYMPYIYICHYILKCKKYLPYEERIRDKTKVEVTTKSCLYFETHCSTVPSKLQCYIFLRKFDVISGLSSKLSFHCDLCGVASLIRGDGSEIFLVVFVTNYHFCQKMVIGLQTMVTMGNNID